MLKILPCLMLLHCFASSASSLAGEITEASDTCGFGLFSWCFWQTAATPSSQASNPWRSEVFTGFKPGMRYYKEEESNCRAGANCSFETTGSVYGADLYRNITGNNRGSDYLDVGIQYSQMPVADWKSGKSFQGSLDNTITSGEGSLRYHFVRFAAKRSNFLYFLHSKYLISSFGLGLGIPQATGVAIDFVGAKRPVPSIGGKLGFQYPLTEKLDIGFASNWNVLWYGESMADAAFLAGYGLNISARI
ncbi:MAG: hypothetical protein NTX25_16770 [Proteobacteria bacterium]|nr:hypothetical protein [Pseudomonadota bacterium]